MYLKMLSITFKKFEAQDQAASVPLNSTTICSLDQEIPAYPSKLILVINQDTSQLLKAAQMLI